MTEQEREMAKKAVEMSVNGFKQWIFLNLKLDEVTRKRFEKYSRHEIDCGFDDIDRISNPNHPANRDEANTFYVEWNRHHPQ